VSIYEFRRRTGRTASATSDIVGFFPSLQDWQKHPLTNPAATDQTDQKIFLWLHENRKNTLSLTIVEASGAAFTKVCIFGIYVVQLSCIAVRPPTKSRHNVEWQKKLNAN
jgi:hypothetical protein